METSTANYHACITNLTTADCSTKVADILKNACFLRISCGWEHFLVEWLVETDGVNFHAYRCTNWTVTSLSYCLTKVAAMLKNGCHLEMPCCWEHFLVKCLMETGRANFHANITNLTLISLNSLTMVAAILKNSHHLEISSGYDNLLGKRLLMPIFTLVSLNAWFCVKSALSRSTNIQKRVLADQVNVFCEYQTRECFCKLYACNIRWYFSSWMHRYLICSDRIIQSKVIAVLLKTAPPRGLISYMWVVPSD